MRFGFLLFITLFAASSQAQLLTIDTAYSAEQLVLQKLLGAKSDLIITNVKYTGSKQSIASFTNDEPEELIDEGVILSTGNVFEAMGPNDARNTSGKTSHYSDPDLQFIATNRVTDAAVLEFDLLALRDSVVFEYVFASEEYPEYVDKGVNDVFGFFIYEINSKALRPRNIALLPDGRTKVSIDNVNHRRNEQYFLRSDFLHVHDEEFWRAHPEMGMRAQLFEFDGFTKVLKATLKLKEGKRYHLKIAISDVGDRLFDSAVMIRANSLEAKGDRIPQADEIVKQYVSDELSRVDQNMIRLDKEELKFNVKVRFNTNESILLEESRKELFAIVELMEKLQSLDLLIIGHTDDEGSESDNMKLSLDRAKSVKDFLSQHGIALSRLSTAGKGESDPLMENDSEIAKSENRRVEFQLSY